MTGLTETPALTGGGGVCFLRAMIRAIHFFFEYFGFYLPKVMGGCPDA